MAIQYIGQATGVNSATLPAHQAGDLLLAFAFRDGSTTAPSLPNADWLNIRNDGANTCSGRIAYRVATASGTASGTWTNATSVVFLVYRGINQSSPIGNNNSNTGVSSTVNYPDLSVTNTSWVVGFVGHRSTNVTLGAPSGMTNRATVADATDEAAGHDTNGAVSSWANTNTSVGGTSSGWRSYVVEINLGSVPATATVTPIQATSAVASISVQIIENIIAEILGIQSSANAGLFLQNSQDWYAWFYDRTYLLEGQGGGLSDVDTLESQTSIEQVTATASQDGTVVLDGLELVSSVDSVGFFGTSLVDATPSQADSSIEEVSAFGDSEIGSGNIQVDSDLEEINGRGGSLVDSGYAQGSGEVGVVSVITESGALVSLVGIDATSFAEPINGIGNSLVSSQALESQSSVATVTATADQPENATAEINNVQASTSLGKVKAIGDKVRKIGGQTLVRPISDKDAIAKVKPILAVGLPKKITAKGLSVQNGSAQIIPIESNTNLSNVSADGILDISDDEILLLLAA